MLRHGRFSGVDVKGLRKSTIASRLFLFISSRCVLWQGLKVRANGSGNEVEPYKYTVTKEYVGLRLNELVKRQDLSKFVL